MSMFDSIPNTPCTPCTPFTPSNVKALSGIFSDLSMQSPVLRNGSPLCFTPMRKASFSQTQPQQHSLSAENIFAQQNNRFGNENRNPNNACDMSIEEDVAMDVSALIIK